MSESSADGAAVDSLGPDNACELVFSGFSEWAVNELRGRMELAGVKIKNVGFSTGEQDTQLPCVTIWGLDTKNSRLLATVLSDAGLGGLVEADPVVIIEPN